MKFDIAENGNVCAGRDSGKQCLLYIMKKLVPEWVDGWVCEQGGGGIGTGGLLAVIIGRSVADDPASKCFSAVERDFCGRSIIGCCMGGVISCDLQLSVWRCSHPP